MPTLHIISLSCDVKSMDNESSKYFARERERERVAGIQMKYLSTSHVISNLEFQ